MHFFKKLMQAGPDTQRLIWSSLNWQNHFKNKVIFSYSNQYYHDEETDYTIQPSVWYKLISFFKFIFMNVLVWYQ